MVVSTAEVVTNRVVDPLHMYKENLTIPLLYFRPLLQSASPLPSPAHLKRRNSNHELQGHGLLCVNILHN